jgi:hypothetical protein
MDPFNFLFRIYSKRQDPIPPTNRPKIKPRIGLRSGSQQQQEWTAKGEWMLWGWVLAGI